MQKPHRKYHIVASIGGDTKEDLISNLRQLVFDVAEDIMPKRVASPTCTFHIFVDEEQTPENYHKQLLEYIDYLDNAKDGNQE